MHASTTTETRTHDTSMNQAHEICFKILNISLFICACIYVCIWSHKLGFLSFDHVWSHQEVLDCLLSSTPRLPPWIRTFAKLITTFAKGATTFVDAASLGLIANANATGLYQRFSHALKLLGLSNDKGIECGPDVCV
jgi:hypothetical protein